MPVDQRKNRAGDEVEHQTVDDHVVHLRRIEDYLLRVRPSEISSKLDQQRKRYTNSKDEPLPPGLRVERIWVIDVRDDNRRKRTVDRQPNGVADLVRPPLC